MKLKVIRPFDLPHKKFSVGSYDVVEVATEENQVSETDLKHWFVKGCISAGRAEIHETQQPAADPAPPEVTPAEGDGTQSVADPVPPEVTPAEGGGTQSVADPTPKKGKK